MDDEKRLTGEEKRARLKEQYKREMQAQKEKLDALKQSAPMRRINEQLNRVMGGVLDKNDEYEEFRGKLDQETAVNEARVDMMLDEFREEVRSEQSGAGAAEEKKTAGKPSAADETLSSSDKTLGDLTAPGSKPEAPQPEADENDPALRGGGSRTLLDWEQ